MSLLVTSTVGDDADLMERYRSWQNSAHLAVTAADPAQRARFHSPLSVRDPIRVFEERLQRLQEIQNRM